MPLRFIVGPVAAARARIVLLWSFPLCDSPSLRLCVNPQFEIIPSGSIRVYPWLTFPSIPPRLRGLLGCSFPSVNSVPSVANNPIPVFGPSWFLRSLVVHRDPRKTKSPCPTLRSDRDKLGMGVRHSLFPALTFGALWLPASRRHSPRQAELPAS